MVRAVVDMSAASQLSPPQDSLGAGNWAETRFYSDDPRAVDEFWT
jgi:hypothetical protein